MLVLPQIQDAGNHLANALSIVADVKDNKACLTSADKVVNVSHYVAFHLELFSEK